MAAVAARCHYSHQLTGIVGNPDFGEGQSLVVEGLAGFGGEPGARSHRSQESDVRRHSDSRHAP